MMFSLLLTFYNPNRYIHTFDKALVMCRGIPKGGCMSLMTFESSRCEGVKHIFSMTDGILTTSLEYDKPSVRVVGPSRRRFISLMTA